MTTHANAQLLCDTYQAIEHGDLRPLSGMLSEDIILVDSTLGPLAGTYTGKDEVPQFFGKMMDVYHGTYVSRPPASWPATTTASS